MADVPNDRHYQKSHEWAKKDGDTVEVGITAFAAEQLGELVYIDLPKVGAEVTAGESFGEIESVKSVNPLYSPVSGKVVAVNEDLESNLDVIGESPYEDGWMIRVECDSPDLGDLLEATAYQGQLDAE